MSGLLINEPFVAVFPSLVRNLGDANLAIILQSIWFQTERRSGEAIITHAELSEHTGISERTVKRGTAKLREMGHLEQRRLSSTDPTSVWRVNAEALTSLSATLSPPSEPVSSVSANLAPDPGGQSGTHSSTKKEEDSSSEVGKPPSDTKPPTRIEVERICKHLAERMVENGCTRPTITKRWRDAARLLLDKDGRTEDQVIKAIDWCQADEFWKANIHSLPTLRQKYDQLRLAAQREQSQAKARPQACTPPLYTPQNEWMERA